MNFKEKLEAIQGWLAWGADAANSDEDGVIPASKYIDMTDEIDKLIASAESADETSLMETLAAPTLEILKPWTDEDERAAEEGDFNE